MQEGKKKTQESRKRRFDLQISRSPILPPLHTARPESKRTVFNTQTMNLTAADPIPDLDTDVVLKVLASLPLRELFHLRLVSKDWNAVLRSRQVLETWSSVAEEAGEEARWLVMVRKADDGAPFTRDLIAYDSASGGWAPLRSLLAACPDEALSTLGGPSLRSVANNPVHDDQCFTNFMAVGGAPGLICFLCSPFIEPPYSTSPPLDHQSSCCESKLLDLAYNSTVFSLLVLNILTGSYDILPPNPKHRTYFSYWARPFFALTVTLTHTLSTYSIFLQYDRNDFPGFLEVYDSRSKTWKIGRSCCGPLEARAGSAADLEKADLIQYKDETGYLFAYSTELDEWSKVYVHPQIWRYCIDIKDYIYGGNTLLKHRGRVLLASVLAAPSSLAGFGVWELRMCPSPISGAPTADWVEVARTPKKHWKGLYQVDMKNWHMKSVKLMSSGSLICMTAVQFTDSEYGGKYYPPLIYDLVNDLWYHLPPYEGGYNFSAAFCLQPSFTAMA